MNITFLIGNGFDLNLKLKTRYSDFYDYYIEHNPHDMISNAIENNYDMWSDLELGLGNLLNNINENQIDEFLDSKEKLEILLAEYLSLENHKAQIKDETALSEEFKNKILNISVDFNSLEQDHYKSIVTATRESISFSFITFNYTDILDRIIDCTKRIIKPFSSRQADDGRNYQDTLSAPLHIHGELTKDLILGLDNSGQIANEKLKDNSSLTKYIIKSEINKALGEKKIEQAKAIIDKSKYVCLFGLSIGDTDALWWAYLIEWLKRDKNNRLVLYVFSKTKVGTLAQQKIRHRDKKRSDFLTRSRCFEDDNTIDLIKDQIIIVPNSQIFNLKHIIIEENENN